MGRLFAKFLAGGLAGLLIFVLFEPFAPKNLSDMAAWDRWEAGFVLFLGLAIGLAVGGLDGYTRGGKQHTIRGLALGGLFGAIGCTLGHGIAGAITSSMLNSAVASGNPILLMLPRTLAFTIIGAALGAAIGASSLNVKKLVQGAIGGALGGAVAGAIFDPLSSAIGQFTLAARGQQGGEVGTPGRAVMTIVMGAAIGLFIGLVERWSRSAWLRLSLGRNEGKEWSIDSAQTFIGRSEGAHVPLFGDGNVAPIHASIQRQGPNYVITDGGSPIGTIVNGQRVQSALLMHGAQIQIGSFVLQFLMKNQAAPVAGPEAYRGQAYPMQQPYAAAQPAQPGAYPTSMPGQMPGAMPGMPMQGGPMPGAQTQMMPNPGMPQPGMPQPGMPQPGMPQPGTPTQAFQPAGPQQTVAYGSGMAGMGGYALLAMDGPLLGQRYPVGGPVEIGREGAGIRMPHDANASRRHAAVSPGVGGVSVQDLGSTNGTYLNGQRVSQATAGPGDLIKVGSTTFRVEPA
ncbi:FHA domain-containing protein [Fimbriimonas ginsengisoli]|uniref:FHA domain containing protein n=1 Tax=Fimbriimonas ginsengisoli Gsoil 348 TaxID=661478 RepID=A0A068NMZ0_FIMGI|nr:FHA domain-containing protein [Fimbriimonas ginsengisoli]AIE84767.1 FHA domain containing protein [Fimbriimonas ginsengisoli Gsoil 348]